MQNSKNKRKQRLKIANKPDSTLGNLKCALNKNSFPPCFEKKIGTDMTLLLNAITSMNIKWYNNFSCSLWILKKLAQNYESWQAVGTKEKYDNVPGTFLANMSLLIPEAGVTIKCQLLDLFLPFLFFCHFKL